MRRATNTFFFVAIPSLNNDHHHHHHYHHNHQHHHHRHHHHRHLHHDYNPHTSNKISDCYYASAKHTSALSLISESVLYVCVCMCPCACVNSPKHESFFPPVSLSVRQYIFCATPSCVCVCMRRRVCFQVFFFITDIKKIQKDDSSAVSSYFLLSQSGGENPQEQSLSAQCTVR